jgi:hypothetical protein
MYANINNPANFQLQDFAQFGFRVITTDFIPVPGEQYRTLYVLQDAVVTATTQKGDDITSKAILAGTLLHGLFNSVSITSGRVLAYAAGRVTADEIIALYEAYVVALGGTLENTQCAIDTLNDTGVDFFADASLVMIPEGYATGVVYGQRPLTSDSQLTFTRASTATRVNSSGLIETVASNVPRLDYSGGSSCGKLLLEPQRSNVCPPQNLHIITNSTIASGQADPFNGTGAYAWREDSATGQHYGLTQQTTTLAVGNQNFSVYVKPVNNTNIYVTWNSPNAGNFGSFTFDFTTQSFTYTNAVNTSFEALANNWYRLSFTINVTVAGSWNVYYNTLITYAGNASKGYDFYAFQIEAGSYPTSFIPTTNFTAVTRLTDDASKTGISSLIGQTEGVFFMDFEYFADLPTTTYFSIDDVAGDNRVLIYGVSAPDYLWFGAS